MYTPDPDTQNMAAWMTAEIDKAVDDARRQSAMSSTPFDDLLKQRLVRITHVHRLLKAEVASNESTESGPVDAKRVVRALEKKPELLEAVTNLLMIRRAIQPPKVYKYTSAFSVPRRGRGKDLHDMLALPLPLDAPEGRYRVKAVFDSNMHLKLFLNGKGTRAAGNNSYMETEIDTRHATPLGERHGNLGGWDYRLTLQTGIVPVSLEDPVVRTASITATYIGEAKPPVENIRVVSQALPQPFATNATSFQEFLKFQVPWETGDQGVVTASLEVTTVGHVVVSLQVADPSGATITQRYRTIGRQTFEVQGHAVFLMAEQGLEVRCYVQSEDGREVVVEQADVRLAIQ